jgi:hypothetical protein
LRVITSLGFSTSECPCRPLPEWRKRFCLDKGICFSILKMSDALDDATMADTNARSNFVLKRVGQEADTCDERGFLDQGFSQKTKDRRRLSQGVRRRSAKPLFSGSNPEAAFFYASQLVVQVRGECSGRLQPSSLSSSGDLKVSATFQPRGKCHDGEDRTGYAPVSEGQC